MTKSQHTPTPWEVTPTLTSEIPICSGQEVICRVYDKDNADHIVLSVNNREKMIAALNLAEKYIEECQKHFKRMNYDSLAPMTEGNGLYLDAGLKLYHIQAALAKAGAE